MRKYKNLPNVAGKLIEKTRIENNISRQDLANKLQLMGINVDTSFVYKIENQLRLLKDFELIAICEILDIDISSLIKTLK